MHLRTTSSHQHLTSISIFTSHSPSLRCFCSIQTQHLVQNEKPRSRNSSKTAKTMANLINFKPWSNGLLSSFKNSLSKTTVLQTLRHIKVPSKAFHFFNWVHENGFSHNPQCYFIMLEILGREKNLNVARNFLYSIEKRSNGEVKVDDKFFNSLIRSYGEAGLFKESVKLFESMKVIGVSPSVVSFNSVLLVLLRRGRINMAKGVYDEMLNTYGVKPDSYTFNILIRGFCKNSMVDEGLRFFQEMTSFACEPDVVTYNTLVDGLCRAGKVKVAHNLVNGMSKRCKDLSPDVVTYTTLIRGYCMKQEVDEALGILDEMNGRGLKANIVTYNTLIKGLCEAQRWDKMKDILEQMKGDDGLVPDACTFNTLMNSHCCAGNIDEAFKVFENMESLQVLADSVSYSVLIRSLCQKGDYDKAEKLFDELFEKEVLLCSFGPKPLAASYKHIFQYLCENGKTKKAERVLRQLMKRGTQDPILYQIVILGHCKEGAFENGYGILIWMLRRDFLPDIDIYDYLIVGFLHKDKPLLAKETLERMLKSSYQPETSTWHSILIRLLEKGCVHESAGVIVTMLERNIRQNINLSTKCLKLLFDRGLQDKAFKINDLIYKNGYRVKMDEVVQFLCKKGRPSEACKMLFFSLKNDQNVEIDLFNTVIIDLCKINKASEAFGLCYELVEKGLHQDLRCLNDLVTALEEEGRIEEAAFVSKRMPSEENFDRSKLARRFIFGKGHEVLDFHTDDSRKKIGKFMESAWKCVYFLSAEIFALAVTYNEPWFTDTSYFWVGPGNQRWPDQKIKLKLKGLYMYGAGFYSYSILALIFWETRRFDFGISMTHHVASLTLIVLSYTFRFVRVGPVVLALHDATDVFLEIGKMSKYSGAETMASFAFVLFVLSFTILRVIYFPFWVLRSTSSEMVPTLKLGKHWVDGSIHYYVFNTLLYCLLILNIYWWVLILLKQPAEHHPITVSMKSPSNVFYLAKGER